MTRLLHSKASPYSAKVRMAAIRAGIDLEHVTVNTSEDPAELVSANPLGKIPTLVLDDGTAYYDSRVILRYLDSRNPGALVPTQTEKRLAAERLEALCDGIADTLIAQVYEKRYRPEEKQHAPWVERQWQKTERGLDALAAELKTVEDAPHCGDLAARSLLAYLGLRFEGRWEKGRDGLLSWAKDFDARFPEIAREIPAA